MLNLEVMVVLLWQFFSLMTMCIQLACRYCFSIILSGSACWSASGGFLCMPVCPIFSFFLVIIHKYFEFEWGPWVSNVGACETTRLWLKGTLVTALVFIEHIKLLEIPWYLINVSGFLSLGICHCILSMRCINMKHIVERKRKMLSSLNFRLTFSLAQIAWIKQSLMG